MEMTISFLLTISSLHASIKALAFHVDSSKENCPKVDSDKSKLRDFLAVCSLHAAARVLLSQFLVDRL